jgi:PadR family transcriptional regulator PadR
MAFRSDLDALILGVLQAGQLHGYEIARRINTLGENALQLKEGQIYPILHRLENDELIGATWIPQEGKPARKMYELTEKGTKALAQKRADWNKFSESVNSLLNPDGRTAAFE